MTNPQRQQLCAPRIWNQGKATGPRQWRSSTTLRPPDLESRQSQLEAAIKQRGTLRPPDLESRQSLDCKNPLYVGLCAPRIWNQGKANGFIAWARVVSCNWC